MRELREVSKSASVVSAARKLRQRSERNARGECLADGPQAVEYGLRAQLVKRIFVTADGLIRFAELIVRAQDDGVEVLQVDDLTLAGLSETRSPQGVLGVAALPLAGHELWQAGLRQVVALDGVQDPGNVGVVLRTADAAGVDFVVLGPGCADPFGTKVIRSSAGSVFGIPILQVGSIEGIVDAARECALRVRGTAADGDLEVFSPSAPDLTTPTMWVFGNEANGLSSEAADACDELVRLPMKGGTESLNLGVAAGICMYVTAAALGTVGEPG